MAYFSHPTATIDEGAVIGEGTRVWHYAHVRKGATIGKNCIIGKSSYIDEGAVMGDNVKVQNFVSIYHGVTLGDDVFVGPSATFTNDLYPRAALWDASRLVKTLVGRGASIGANATVVCGLKIGEYAMIGAGSVVTKDVPRHTLVYGNPARAQGFVCKCGRKLGKEKKLYTCPDCGEKTDLR